MSRQYLESISTMDLISLANEYGIDIPDNLDRRFIIEELLDTALEMEQDGKTNKEELVENSALSISQELPVSYNETKISAILRNPGWAYVYWDLRETVRDEMRKDIDFEHLSLHVVLYDNPSDEKASDFFDIELEKDDRDQFILIPGAKRAFTVHLVYNSMEAKPKVLASTKRVELPAECSTLSQMQPGKKLEFPEIIELSGMEKLLKEQYNQHRQLFS